MYLQETHQEMR